MYARYQYNSGVQTTVQANILADLLAILTGEVNVSNLSASCDKVNSTITVDNPAGWVLHDAAAGTNAKTIKAPLADDQATFKHLVLDTNTNGTLYIKVFETWDATAHTGTNNCTNSAIASYAQQFSTTTGGILHVFATARFVLVISQMGSTWGSTSNSGGCGCFERTRACPWDTVAAGYPPYLFANLGYWSNNLTGATMPRKLLRTGVVNTGSTATVSPYVVPFGDLVTAMSNINGADQKVQNASGVGLIPLLPILVADNTSMPTQYGEISSLCDIWLVPQGVAANLDTIVVNSINYLVVQAFNTTKLFAVRKG